MVELVSDVGVELIDAAASDNMVAMAAWVSNDADSAERLADTKRVEGLINFLYRNKHMSPFEHGHFTFKVDVPLFVAREFHRHRTASYNEVSGRYTEMKPRFYCGDVARVQQGKMGNYYFVDGTDEQTALYRQSKRKKLKKDWEVYQSRLEAGISKEQAREDLPLSLMTQFYVTMNPRNLMQFLALRNDKHALKEIRDTAVKMEEIFADKMPLTYGAYKKVRDAEAEDTDALKERIKHLESSLVSLRAARNASYDSMVKAQAERDEAFKVRDEAVEKYNGLLTSMKEAEKEETAKRDYQEPPYDFPGNSTGSFFEDLMGKAEPIFNIYVDAKRGELSPEDIAKRVKQAIDRLERRDR